MMKKTYNPHYTMRQIIISAVAALMAILSVMPASAQNQSKANQEELLAKRIEMLTAELGLGEDSAAEFEQIYRAYRKDIRMVATNKKSRVKPENITNENAIEYLQAKFMNNIAMTTVKQNYINEFLRVLTPVQIEKMYRIDDKIANEARKILRQR